MMMIIIVKSSKKKHKINKTNMYLERRITLYITIKQVIQCCLCSFCYFLFKIKQFCFEPQGFYKNFRERKWSCFPYVGDSPVYRPSGFGLLRVIWKEIVSAPSPLESPLAGGVQTIGKGSQKRRTLRTPQPSPLRTSASHSRQPIHTVKLDSSILPRTLRTHHNTTFSL